MEHGFLSPGGEVPVGVSVTIFCDVGYRLDSKSGNTATCMDSSVYSHDIVSSTTCIQITEGISNNNIIPSIPFDIYVDKIR